MKDYKKVMLQGLDKSYVSGTIHKDELEHLREMIQDTYLEQVEELDSRLGIELFDYKISIEYEQGDIPRSVKHTLMARLNEKEGAIKMNFIGVLHQIEDILSTGDDEILIGSCNLGIIIVIRA